MSSNSKKQRRKWAKEDSDSGGTGGENGRDTDDNRRREKEIEKELEKFLDGTHCFDEICTELMISEKELGQRLKAKGDVQIICR